MEKGKVAFRDRQQLFYRGIAIACAPVYRIRCVSRLINNRDYVITLRKRRDISVEDRLLAIDRFLKDHILDHERLSLENDCFVITGESYHLTFSVEWYKNAQKGLSIYGKEFGIKQLHRIGVERALRVLRHGLVNCKVDETEMMQQNEMMVQYPNPADRFARLILNKRDRCFLKI